MPLRDRKGFTFFELMMVTLIITTILALALPNFRRSLAHYELHAAGRQMVSEIRKLQQLALTGEKYSYKILFHVDPGRNNRIDQYDIMSGINTLKIIKLPPSVNLYNSNFASNTLRLNCSGNPVYGFGGTIQLENSFNERLYIIVAKTGRVRMDDKPPASSKYY